jgi:hypothetical protein
VIEERSAGERDERLCPVAGRWVDRSVGVWVDRCVDARQHRSQGFVPDRGTQLGHERPRRGVAERLLVRACGRGPRVEGEGRGLACRGLRGGVVGRLDGDIGGDPRRDVAGQALADPARLDEVGRQPYVGNLVQRGERGLVEGDQDLRPGSRRLGEAGGVGRDRLRQGQDADVRVRKPDLLLEQRQGTLHEVEGPLAPRLIVVEGADVEVGRAARERDRGVERRELCGPGGGHERQPLRRVGDGSALQAPAGVAQRVSVDADLVAARQRDAHLAGGAHEA